VLDDLRFISNQRNPVSEVSEVTPVEAKSESPLHTIVEAQGWLVAADETVRLVAESPEVTPHSSGLPIPGCH
jgi:large exoprotein involved in heme utilization and adhesion